MNYARRPPGTRPLPGGARDIRTFRQAGRVKTYFSTLSKYKGGPICRGYLMTAVRRDGLEGHDLSTDEADPPLTGLTPNECYRSMRREARMRPTPRLRTYPKTVSR